MDFDRVTVPVASLNVLGPFVWPDVSGSVDGIVFWGVACQMGTYEVVGDVSRVEFGYGP